MIKIEYEVRPGVILNETEMYNVRREYEVLCTAEYFQDYVYDVSDKIAVNVAEEIRHRQEKTMDWGGYESDGEILDNMMSDLLCSIKSWLETNGIECEEDKSDNDLKSVQNLLNVIYSDDDKKKAFEEYFERNSLL